MTVSVGVATSGGGPEAGRLLRAADLALYVAKARGRDQWAVYDESMGADPRPTVADPVR